MENVYLVHHGVKGMKWGRRRYQNKDGSLTQAGRKRYDRDAREQKWTKGDDGLYRSGGKKNKKVQDPDPSKWVKEDLTRHRRLSDETANLARNASNLEKQTRNNKKHERMDLSHMSDKEMRDRINRELLERQYDSVFNPPTVSKGREHVSHILDTTVAVLGVTSSALGIALAIKELKG